MELCGGVKMMWKIRMFLIRFLVGKNSAIINVEVRGTIHIENSKVIIDGLKVLNYD
jgi:hypothetical protein